MIEKSHYIEFGKVAKLALVASKLRYDALARLVDEIAEANIENEWGLDTNALVDAKEALERAYELSARNANPESLAKHPDTYDKIRYTIMQFKLKDVHLFLRLLIKNLNDNAEKDFQKGYKKLCEIMLTNEKSTIRSLRRALGLARLNNTQT